MRRAVAATVALAGVLGVLGVLGGVTPLNDTADPDQSARQLVFVFPWCAELSPVLRERWPEMAGSDVRSWRAFLNEQAGTKVQGDAYPDEACRVWYRAIVGVET